MLGRLWIGQYVTDGSRLGYVTETTEENPETAKVRWLTTDTSAQPFPVGRLSLVTIH